jgi:response regulator RpfG family c-di-GMP phosphodiesterase
LEEIVSKKDISILITDDDESVRKVLVSHLNDTYVCTSAASAEEATQAFSAGNFNLLLTDIQMPGTSGLELCDTVHKMSPDTVVVVISSHTEIQYAVEAMRQGAFDYITKPFDLPQVTMSIDRALRYQALVAAKRNYEHSLEETVRLRTNELRVLNDNLNQMLEALYTNYRETLRALAETLEARDFETRGHSDRVVAYCLRLGVEMGLKDNDLIALEQGALLHDIGKIGVPDSILLKPGPLTDDQWIEMRQHINHGVRIIDRIDFLSGARPVVAQHHEKYDGSGYPEGLCGDSIHINARIFAVADTFDAITSDRPYRAAQSYTQARSEIVAKSSTHFDPVVVQAFLNITQAQWDEIRRAARSGDYLEQIMDQREIRSFIVSLKHRRKGSGPHGVPSPTMVS